MNLLDMLRRTGGLSALSRRLGLTPAQSMQVAEAFLPYMVSGYGRVFRRVGSDAFVYQLGRLGGEEMAQTVLISDVIEPAAGEAALTLAFGSAALVDGVEAALRKAVNVEPGQYREAMRILAMLFGGYLASRAERHELGVPDGIGPLLERSPARDPLKAVEAELGHEE